MKIDGADPIAHIKEIINRAATSQARPAASGGARPPVDRLEVSSAAREFHAVREASLREPEVRTELISRFRGRIEAGTYEPNARIIAQRVLDALREGPGA